MKKFKLPFFMRLMPNWIWILVFYVIYTYISILIFDAHYPVIYQTLFAPEQESGLLFFSYNPDSLAQKSLFSLFLLVGAALALMCVVALLLIIGIFIIYIRNVIVLYKWEQDILTLSKNGEAFLEKLEDVPCDVTTHKRLKKEVERFKDEMMPKFAKAVDSVIIENNLKERKKVLYNFLKQTPCKDIGGFQYTLLNEIDNGLIEWPSSDTPSSQELLALLNEMYNDGMIYRRKRRIPTLKKSVFYEYRV